MRSIHIVVFGTLSLLIPFTLAAQVQHAVAPLTNWAAPLYWQPSHAEDQASRGKSDLSSNSFTANAATDLAPQAQTPANSLVFVGMTPCRVVDTRMGQGFTGFFGPPYLIAGTSRIFPIQSSTTCSIPSIAQAYSFNITVAPFGFLDYITVWPTGQPRPNASTLNGYVNTVIANAAIVPAGTNGSVDVYASQNTELIIDINGYYAPQTGVTLAQGTAAAPALSFANDPATGIFSSGAGTVNIATAGTNRLTVRSDGDLDLSGSIRKNGTLFLHSEGTQSGLGLGTLTNSTGANNTATGNLAMFSNTTGLDSTANGYAALYTNTSGSFNTATGTGALLSNTTGPFNTAVGRAALYYNSSGSGNTAVGYNAGGGFGATNANTTGSNNTFIGSSAGPGTTTQLDNATAIGASTQVTQSNSLVLGNGANVGIGTTAPLSRLDVRGDLFVGLNAVPAFPGGNTLYLVNDSGDSHNSFRVDGYANDLAIIADSGAGAGAGTSITFRTSAAGMGETDRVKIDSDGTLKLFYLGATSGGPLCRNGSAAISFCSSSLRYKTDVTPFLGGTDIISRLRPIRFTWKEDGQRDIGLGAEEVADVEPLLTFRNDEGEIEGVRYNQLSAVFINAFKEQQAQIEDQRSIITDQEKRMREQQEQSRKLEERLAALEALLSGKPQSGAGGQ